MLVKAYVGFFVGQFGKVESSLLLLYGTSDETLHQCPAVRTALRKLRRIFNTTAARYVSIVETKL